MIGAVLLAGGASTRFGSDKLLINLPDGRSLAEAAWAAVAPHVGIVAAVVAPGQHARSALFRKLRAAVVECPLASLGMGHSLAAGVAALAACRAYVIALADMPWMQSATIAQVVNTFLENPNTLVVAPRWCGRVGHPVLFSAQLRSQLLDIQGDRGARAIMERHAGAIRYCDVDDIGVVRDVDRPSDLTLQPVLEPMISPA